MRCSVCQSASRFSFTAKLLARYEVSYFTCPVCGFLQTEEPFWLPEAYRHSMNAEDTGILQRNFDLADVTARFITSLFDRHGRFLDFGGGHGVFTRLMRDRGFDFYWDDPRSENIFARGFEFTRTNGAFELITAIECFEHFTDPMRELKTMVAISSNIFFTTQIAPAIPPGPEEWDYYGFTHGQHIAFYTEATLRYLAQRYDLALHTNGVNAHLFTRKKIAPRRFTRALRPKWWRKYLFHRACKNGWWADYERIVKDEG